MSDRSLAHSPPFAPRSYVTIRELGSGGMARAAVARRADQPQAPPVCLKRLHPALARDAVQRAHFVDEGRLLARLCHPNVLAVLDASTDDEGAFLVTELVDGVDLRRFLAWLAAQGEPMPEPLALRVAKEVADALAHAHAHGVIHRDVTPANVLLGRDGRVVLIDFGIARSDAQTQRTRTGLVKGKVAYMAPEQALGGAIDARVDLFALGVVLFEMLAGARPHDGAGDVETVTNAMRGHRRALARPVSARGLEDLLARLLASAPERRPADALLVASELTSMGLADTGDLARWVRAAADAPDPTRATTRDGATRRRDRARDPQTCTIREDAITTAEQPPAAPRDATPSDGRAWVQELDVSCLPVDEPPTVVDAAPLRLGEDTCLTPRVVVSSSLTQASTPRSPGRGTGRRVIETVVTLLVGLLAGAFTGGAAALVLRALL